MIFVYVLQSTIDNGYYIGITKDLVNRISKHNDGHVFSTKNRRPLGLIYKEMFSDYKTARSREVEIKSYKGGNSFKNLIGA